MEGSILTHTRSLAAELAHRFAHDPAGELEIWATTAQQREAMVVKLYDADAIEHRLPKLAREPEVLPIVRKVIAGIWAQERSHTTLVGSLRVLDEQRLTLLRSMMGAVEGRVARQATTTGWSNAITAFLLGLTRAAGLAPEFTKDFRLLTPRQFFRFSHELETTAKEGYARILELLASLDEAGATGTDGSFKFGITGSYEFAKTRAEEGFHAAVFEQLEQWLAPDGLNFVDIPARDAVKRLHTLATANLFLASPPASDSAGANRPWTKSLHPVLLVSDGGLGPLFEEFGMPLPVVAGDAQGS